MEKAEKDALNSFISNHQSEHHNGDMPDFKEKVLKSFKGPISRQVYEGIYSRRQDTASLNNFLLQNEQGGQSWIGLTGPKARMFKNNFHFLLIPILYQFVSVY